MSEIIFKKGDIFEANVQALVNPVNCFGLSLDGLAAQFKKRFPENYSHYKIACFYKELRIGTVFAWHERGRTIINFPTVRYHIFFKSYMEFIDTGLNALLAYIKKHNIKSIAIPALGCGIGGLKWEKVKALMVARLGGVQDCQIIIFEPM